MHCARYVVNVDIHLVLQVGNDPQLFSVIFQVIGITQEMLCYVTITSQVTNVAQVEIKCFWYRSAQQNHKSMFESKMPI